MSELLLPQWTPAALRPRWQTLVLVVALLVGAPEAVPFVDAPAAHAETDEEAYRRASGWTFFQFALRFYATHGTIEPGSVSLWEEYLKWSETPKGKKLRRTGLIGSPDTLRRKLRKFEASNVDQVILLNQAGNNTHEDITASLELFAQEVMPEFHAREPDHQDWKRDATPAS